MVANAPQFIKVRNSDIIPLFQVNYGGKYEDIIKL